MQRFARWLLGSPFRQSAAPPGDLIRVCEAKTAEIERMYSGSSLPLQSPRVAQTMVKIHKPKENQIYGSRV